MKVLVTGPDGVLGSNLVRELLSRDYEVIAMSENGKKSPTIDNLNITKIGGNLLNPEDVEAAIEGVDYVIHCAASTAMWPSMVRTRPVRQHRSTPTCARDCWPVGSEKAL